MVTFHSDHPYMKASYVSERIPAGANPLRLKDRSDTLLSWMGQSKATEQEFATRLQSKGLNLDEFNQLLANKDIPATLHTGWMHDLDSILNQTPESWLTQHVHMGIGVVVLPFLYEYSEQVRRWSSLSTTGKILQEPVLNSLQAGFLRDLRMVADRTSVYMYHLAKEQEPDLTLETYVKRLASGMTEIRKMLEQFPVLARILTEMSLRAANNTIELLERLLNDYDEIATMYFDGKQLRLKSVQTGAGDTHQNGRTVTILEFDSNIKLIYKPRSLDTDLAFAEWLRYLNNKGLRYELKGPLTLSKQQYGWQEFVEHRACQNEAEVRKYYYRMGMLCGILYAFQSTDMHYENIVACGDIPYIIDYETLLANNIYDEEKLDFPMSMLYRSVFLSGLIPVGQVFRSQIDFDLSGIGGKPDQTSTNMKGWVLKQDNTDEVQYVEVPFKTAQLQHLVQLNGQIIEPVRYLAEISEGFREIYQIMANEKETIKREIRERFGKLTGRALLRPTFLYGRFLAASQHPKYLRNGLDREKLLEMLWNIVKVDKRFEQIVPTEIDDLLNNDIPYYTFPIDDTCLYTSDQRKIPNIFKKTCLAWIEEKLDRYSQKDLANQLHLLQYAIHSAQVEHMALPEMEALDYVESLPLTSSQFDPTATAINIANYLLEYRLTEQGHSTWLGLRNHDNRFRLTLLDFSLYSGTLGISMFLGLMYVQTGNSEYRNAAMENFRYVISVFERVADDELSPSVFNGRGSVVYAGFFLDALFDFPEARQAARLQLTKIKQYSGQPLSAQPVDELQSNLDFLDGYAGIITLCVHIWERFAEPEALETARIYAERLCQHLKQDQAKLVGFAHGSSGMIYALRKIEAYDLLSPDEGVLDTLLQFERSNYDSTRANWMDLRGHVEDRLGSYYWCHGAPGVLLGRSELDEPIDEAERLKLLNAMLEHAASNPRLSLCHGIFGMMEILLSLANNPGWQASSSMIHDAIWGLVNRASVSSQIEGMKDRGLVGLMLGVSGIGWTCLRLANAELPSVMTLQFPAKAVSITEQANPVLAEEGGALIRKRNIPFIEQMSQTECGIACMAMLCAYYGKHVTLFELRDRIGSGRDGNTLYDLKRLGEDLGLEAKCYKIEDLNLLSQLKEPLICFWEQKHYVVLERISSKYYYILDPAQGRMKLNKEQFMHSFSNYVLHGKPGTLFQQQKPKSLWKPYLEMLWKKPKLLTFMLFTNLLLQLFVLISPIFVQQMIDNIAIQDNSKYINVYLLGMIVSFALYFVFALIKNEVSIHVFKYLDRSMSWQYFRHLLVIPYNFFQIRSTGDLMYRFSNLRSIRLILSNQVMKSILDAILFIVIVSYMLVKSPLLSIYVFLFAGLLYIGIQLLRPHLHEASRNELSKDTKLFSYQNESVSGILNIKITGAEETVSQRWKSYYDHFVKAFVTRERLYGILGAFSGGLTMYMPLFIIWIGAGHVAAGGLSLGELIAFQTIAVYFISTANSLILSLETFYQLKVYLRRIRDVVDTPAEVPDGTKLLQAELTGEIVFERVSFAYTAYSEPVLKDLNFQIQAGQKIAIIGASGSGKSTLANLLVGLYQPSEGEIYYGPHRLEELDKPYIRQQMGIVNQQPFMFNQSIVDNIKGNNEQVTMEDIVQAAKVAQIHDEIMKMPMKYETLLSENAQNMSGGQRQRLAIARALVHLPKVIVFDEATNALDSINEKKIDEFLSRLQCTRIVIAHRLSTIMDADQIFVMSNGSIVEKGRHDELIQTSTYYQNLVEAYRFMDMKGGEKHVISSVEKPVFQNS